jgi:hypothetical protein
MPPENNASAIDAFEQAALAVASLRVPVRRGRTSADDVRRHAARAAAQFYLTTVWKRTARAGLPSDAPDSPVLTRRPARPRQDDKRGG